jgi:2,4-dienoyl-CoA reductase-like NADH-dependent reductase (Old Yellow Enzyme family)
VHVAGEGADWVSAAAVGTTTLTRLAREIVGVPVIANGSLHVPAAAQKLLVDGEADLIAIGRGAIVNPDWPARVREGRELRRWERGILSPLADLATQDAWLSAHPVDESGTA